MQSLALPLLATLTATMAAPPEQVHLSYTGKPGELAVDFVLSKSGPATIAVTQPNGAVTTVNSTSFYFNQIGYMHQALMKFPGIAPGASATYQITSDASGESTDVFTVTPELTYPERYALLADFGLVNDACMKDITEFAKNGEFDSVAHAGDWAYDFEDLFSVQGNVFMNLVQGYAATKPVMPAEGNHEACTTCEAVAGVPQSGLNFTQYRARFAAVSMYAGVNSGSGSNRYYSYERGLVHWVVLTAEAYLYTRTPVFLANQLAWLKKDLAAVDRSATPWIVVQMHKDWTMAAEAFQDFQPILDQYNVDLLFCGHVHNYNRYMPYDSVTGDVDTAAVSADGSVYTEPKYMTVIVNGASGDIEGDDKYTKESPSYTGTENYGWGIFTAVNASVATWNFHTVKVDNGPADYSDSLTIIRTH